MASGNGASGVQGAAKAQPCDVCGVPCTPGAALCAFHFEEWRQSKEIIRAEGDGPFTPAYEDFVRRVRAEWLNRPPDEDECHAP